MSVKEGKKERQTEKEKPRQGTNGSVARRSVKQEVNRTYGEYTDTHTQRREHRWRAVRVVLVSAEGEGILREVLISS